MANSDPRKAKSGEDTNKTSSADRVRANLAELNLTEQDLVEAVAWARTNPSMKDSTD